jgi:hypothetical protein
LSDSTPLAGIASALLAGKSSIRFFRCVVMCALSHLADFRWEEDGNEEGKCDLALQRNDIQNGHQCRCQAVKSVAAEGTLRLRTVP